MNKSQGSRPPEHFESLYRANADPWGYATSPYERQKYDTTLGTLGTKRFQAALEIGCSIGVFTELLATRCARLLALDFAPHAVAAARMRCAAYPQVRVEQMQIPGLWPEGRFDLIVLSEVLYFLTEDDLKQTCERIESAISSSGQVILVNYTEPTSDPHSGDAAASFFISATAPYLQLVLQRREPHYRLDLLSRF